MVDIQFKLLFWKVTPEARLVGLPVFWLKNSEDA